MKLKIEINTDNAAFVDDFEGEVKQCLDQVSEYAYRLCNGYSVRIRDTNGNTVGTAKLEE